MVYSGAPEEGVRDGRLDDGALQWLESQFAAVVRSQPTEPGAAPLAEEGGGATDAALLALLDLAERRGSSDLHLGTGALPVLRHDGELYEISDLGALDDAVLTQMLLSPLSAHGLEQLERTGSADTVLTLPSGARSRVNVFRRSGGLAGVFRILPRSIPTLDELGLPRELEALARAPRGLLLVTGPTGAGKTTTIASIIDGIIASQPVHVVTLEDPIEYRLSGSRALISQRQIGEDAADFASGLRQAVRQDPDVLVIGEMRDPETIAAAVTAAETGHLVISTLHSRTAQGTITRIVDSFGDHRQDLVRTQLANALVGIVSQQLITRRSGARVLAAELLVATSAVRNLIREGAVHQIAPMLETGAEHGMQSMDRCLARLVRSGTLTQDEAMERCVDPVVLREHLR